MNIKKLEDVSEEQKVFRLIKKIFPECTETNLHSAYKSGNEYYLIDIIKYLSPNFFEDNEVKEKTCTK